MSEKIRGTWAVSRQPTKYLMMIHGKVVVYTLQQVSGEKAAWEFVADEKPGFSFNVIIPV